MSTYMERLEDQMTALDLLITLQRFRTAALAYVPNSVLDPYLAEFDAACEHLKSRYQEEATKINLEDRSPCRDTIFQQGYNAKGEVTFIGYRGSVDTDRDHRIMEAAIELYYAGAVRKQDNITPEVLWKHIMGEEWSTPDKVFYNRLSARGLGGEVLGAPHPDWPSWCTSFNERLAYQHGVADARALAKDTAETPTIHYDVVFEFANKHNLQYNDIAAMISRAMEPRPASKELL